MGAVKKNRVKLWVSWLRQRSAALELCGTYGALIFIQRETSFHPPTPHGKVSSYGPRTYLLNTILVQTRFEYTLWKLSSFEGKGAYHSLSASCSLRRSAF